ncbi:hypothetical protein BU16DRAFT_596301 [Lophium mytilinum]|uniref:Uncharacterized protein n=1 Tax=Lophium mytilinum TaxID=390894 RepID=A0A6A6QE78_9PEZI|nr:hypothetical protein BU16DRAFT_596301 [Lophium mytilinum]
MPINSLYADTQCLICEGTHFVVTKPNKIRLQDAIVTVQDPLKRLDISAILFDIDRQQICEIAMLRAQAAANISASIEQPFLRHIEDKDRMIEELKSRLADRDSQLEKTRQATDVLEREITNLNDELGNRDATIQRLEERVPHLEGQLAEARNYHEMVMRAKHQLADDLKKTTNKFEASKKVITMQEKGMSELRAAKRVRTEPLVHKLQCLDCFKTDQSDCDGSSNCQNCQSANTLCTYRLCKPYHEKSRYSHGKGCTKLRCTQLHDEDREGYRFS